MNRPNDFIFFGTTSILELDQADPFSYQVWDNENAEEIARGLNREDARDLALEYA